MTAPTRVRKVREVVLPSVTVGGIVGGVSAFADILTERQLRPKHTLTVGALFAGGIAVAAIRQQRSTARGWVRLQPVKRHWWQRQKPVRRYEPPPSLETFVGVVPIVQSQTHDAQTITLLSLDSYAEGFHLRARYRVEEGQRRSLRSMAQEFAGTGLPRFDVRASDDKGTDYRSSPGGGSALRHGWQFAMTFGPGLPTDAEELTLAIPPPRWSYFNGHSEYFDAPPPTNTSPLWTFTIPLAGRVAAME